MNFVSLKFVLFFAAVFALYWQLSRRNQNVLLLVASCLFYAAWDWRFLSLIGVSTLTNFYCGRNIALSDDPRARRWWLWSAVTVNLGMLFYFKYAAFFAESLVALARGMGGDVSPITLNILLRFTPASGPEQKSAFWMTTEGRNAVPARHIASNCCND